MGDYIALLPGRLRYIYRYRDAWTGAVYEVLTGNYLTQRVGLARDLHCLPPNLSPICSFIIAKLFTYANAY